MSYGPNFPDLFRRAAEYVDKILHGTEPADLPVEQPTKFDLVINLTTAKALGLTIPEPFLLRANEVMNKSGQCLLLAQSRHKTASAVGSLSGGKRTSSARYEHFRF